MTFWKYDRPVGPFYFAWTDEPPTGGATFGPEHQVEDEQIVSFRIDQAEGSLPTLNIDIRNPRRGLLSGQVWAWLSYDTGTAAWCRCSSAAWSAFPPTYCRKW